MEIARAGGSRGPSPAFLAAALAGDPTRPALTYYDDATGERTELSGLTLGNWVVKTTNLLVDGCGLGPGDRAALLLPPHWQTAAVLLGAFTAGLTVDLADTGEPAYQVAFVAAERLDLAPPAEQRFVLGLAPMGVPLAEVPDGYLDYAREVLAHGDRLPPFLPPAPEAGEWVAAAAETAAVLGLARGDRLLIDAGRLTDPVRWLLAPLAAGASVVLCAHLDPGAVAGRVAAERVTRVM